MTEAQRVDVLYKGAKVAERLYKQAKRTYGVADPRTARMGQEWLDAANRYDAAADALERR